MRYFTHYEEYPIYEPAEGGYYYAGNQIVTSERLSKRQCKKRMRELIAQCEAENAEKRKREERTGQRFDYWGISSDKNEVWLSSRYIGEGESYVIERRRGSRVKGYEPYC